MTLKESTSTTYGEGDTANSYYSNTDPEPFNKPRYSTNSVINKDINSRYFININPKPEYKYKGYDSTFIIYN